MQRDTVSVIIPAVPRDARYLPELLRRHLAGSVVPDEVIISLSCAHQVSAGLKRDIEAIGAQFRRFRLLRHPRVLRHGPNRQAAVDICTGDIVSFIDCDDLPHPQRLQVLTDLFASRDIVHCVHSFRSVAAEPADASFRPMPDGPDVFSFPTLPADWTPYIVDSETLYRTYFPNGGAKDCVAVTRAYGGGIPGVPLDDVAAGHPTVRRAVLEKVGWHDWHDLPVGVADDYDFDMQCLYLYNKSIILDLPLANARRRDKRRMTLLERKTRTAIGNWRHLVGYCNLALGRV